MLRALAVLLAVVGVGSALLPSALAQGGGPVLGGTVANQVYIQGLAITDLVLPAATGGTAPLTYNLVGARPAGLNFDLPTRTLSGIPTAAQAATTYTWRVTDANSVTDEETFTIQVDADVPPAFPASTTIANQSYIEGFAIANLVLPAATGGNTPLSYQIVGGLPQGLSVDPTTLTLSGAPTVAQAATTYTWRVTDQDGDTDDRTFTIEVAADVPPAFPASTTIANQSYIEGFAIANLVLPTATGGNGTLSYEIVGGPPQGLSVDPTTLTLSGAPTVAQAATTYTWRVTDLDGDTDDRTFTIEVDADVSPTLPAQPPIGDRVYIDGVAITDLVLPTATGGNGTLTYALVGTPPTGLNFDLATRTLSGTPTGTQTPTTYTWRVTDVDGDTAEETFTIEVEPDTNPTLATVGNQVYTEGRTITDLVLPAGAGGNAPLTYLLVGALPSGLAPPGSTRTISGTPTATQAESTYTWRVTDADGDVAEQTFTIEVVPPLAFVFPPDWFNYRKFPKDVAITPWVWPGATGGKGPLTYSLNPSPPLLPGLTVDTSTRTLSGTPTAITTIVDYTWTVTDAVGNQESTIIGIGIRAATGVPNPPTLTSVVPGSVPEQLVVTLSWSGPCALLGPRAGYTVEYRKSTSSWRRAFDVTPGSPNNATNGAFDIYQELGAGPVTETFIINSTATGLAHAGQTGAALDPEPYEVRATVYSGIGGCDSVSLYSNSLSATPISAVPALDGTIADQVYIEQSAITDLVLPAGTGGNSPLTYSLTPALPQGLSVNLATRTLSGTPTVAQAATTYTWKVEDGDGDTDEEEFTITVLADESPQLPATPPIPDQSYIEGVQITALVLPAATGGNAPLTYSLTPTPPQGLSVNLATRTLTGTPTVTQAATTYTWRVTDTDGDTAEQEFTIEVLADQSPQLTAVDDVTYIAGSPITPLVLPEGTGGNAPLTHLLVGTPPAGLTFDTPTRTLSGTPTAAQAATTYTWRVTDTDGDTAEQEFTITVLADQSPQLTAVDDVTYIAGSPITPLVLPEGTGGNAPLTHLLVGTPPAGLTFDTPTRTLSGTPTAAQAATTYTWRVTDCTSSPPAPPSASPTASASGVSNVSPAGGVPTRRCVKGAFPPVPSGSTSGVIAGPRDVRHVVHCRQLRALVRQHRDRELLLRRVPVRVRHPPRVRRRRLRRRGRPRQRPRRRVERQSRRRPPHQRGASSGAFPPVPSGSTSGVIADPAMYVTSSTAVSCGLWSPSTVIVNSCSAVSPSVSVTRHVYVVAACAAVGVPDSVRVGVSNVSPAGGVPTRRCVKGAFPPVPSGSTSGVIADPAMYVTSSTAVSCGLWSASTVIVNSCSAVSPSVSVTRHVYVVADCAAVGVPDSVRVGVSNVSPAGGVPTRRCVSGAFPPVPSGSTSGVIADPAMYVTSSTAVSCGLWSASTVIVNSCSAVSPSVSVTRHVYVVADCAAVGVPDSVRVGVSNVSPAGGVPTRRCVSGAFPPVPSGSTSGVIADPAM